MTGKKKSSGSCASSKKYTCPTCGYVTFLKARFTKHVKYHSMPFIKCEFCDFRTQYTWNLDRHMKNHNSFGEMGCPLCNFTCDMKQSLTSHLQNHHNNVPEEIMAQYRGCPAQAKKSPVSSEIGSRRESFETEFAEDLVLLESMKKVKTEDEKKLVLTKKFYKCRYCNFNALSESSLNRHLGQNHLNDVPKLPSLVKNALDFISDTVNPQSMGKKLMPNLIPIPKVTSSCGAKAKSNSLLEPDSRNTWMVSISDEERAKINFLSNFALSPKGAENEHETKTVGNEEEDKSQSQSITVPFSTSGIKKNNKLLTQRRTSFFDKLSKKLTSGQSQILSQPSSFTNSSSITKKPSTCSIPPTFSNSTRCQYCRHRCKTSADLINHLEQCEEAPNNNHLLIEEDSYESLIRSENQNEDEEDNDGGPMPIDNSAFLWKTEPEDVPVEEEDGSGGGSQYFHNFDGFSGLNIDTENSSEDYQQNDNITSPGTSTASLSSPNSVHVTKSRKVYKCPQNDCGFWATTASRFHVHIVGHYNTKPFECSQCSYRSNWRWDITKHIRLKTIRDPSHAKAKVLLTHKSGERNYRKYDRYLVPMELTWAANSKIPDCSTVASKRPDVELIPYPSPSYSPTSARGSTPSPFKGNLPAMPKLFRAPVPTTNEHESISASPPKENFHLLQALSGAPKSLIGQKNNFLPDLKHAITITPIPSSSIVNGRKLGENGKSFVEKNIMAGGEFIVQRQHFKQQQDPNSILKPLKSIHSSPLPLFLCEKCPARFLYEKELRIHLTFHEKRSEFTCNYCSYSARSSYPHLMTHMKVHSIQYQEKTESMLQDGKYVIAPKLRVESKLKRRGTLEPSKLPPAVTITPTSTCAESDSSEDVSDPSISCPRCPAKFNSIQSFYLHTQHHGHQTPFMCHICDFGADSKNNLTLHAILHRGSEITIEPEIDLDVDDDEEMVIEDEDMLIPTVILPEEDEDDEDDMAKDVPNGLELYSINPSEYNGNPEFSYPTYVKNGRVKSKRYKCFKCPSAFEKRDQYRVHMGLHGSNQRYKCTVCDYSVTYYANFIQHLKKHENQPNVSKEQLIATPLSKIRKQMTIAEKADMRTNVVVPRVCVNTVNTEKKVPPLVLKVPNNNNN